MKHNSIRRILSFVMAVAILGTAALPGFALEAPLNYVNLTDGTVVGEAEYKTMDSSGPAASGQTAAENGNASAPEDIAASDAGDQTDISKSESTPHVMDSGPPLEEPSAENDIAEPAAAENGFISPEGTVSFEVVDVNAAPVASLFGLSRESSLVMYMQKIEDIAHYYPFSSTSTYDGYIFYLSDGQTAYCVEPARFNSVNNSVVTGSLTYDGLTQTQQNQIARAIAANSTGHSNAYRYFATQAIIWEIAYNQPARRGSVYTSVIAKNAGKLSTYYEEIRSAMESMGEIPSFMGPDPIKPPQYEMIEDGGIWSIELENDNANVTLSADDFKSKGPLEFSVSGDVLTVTSPSEPDNQSLTEWHSTSGESGLIFWNSSVQTKASFDTTKGVPGDGYMVFYENFTPPEIVPEPEEKVGYLKIYKFDGETNLPLGGAVFKIESETYVNDSFSVAYGGDTVVIPIPEGKDSIEVTVTEVTAPALYAADSTPKTVTVTAGDTVNIAELSFTNYPLECSLTIYKHEKGNRSIPLEGARFHIRYADPTVSSQEWTRTTDSNGLIHIDLPSSGTLLIEELEAPPNYVIGEDNLHTVIVQKGQNERIDISNDKKAQLLVYKKDKQSGQLLSGAVIRATLLRSHTEPYEQGIVHTVTTDENGCAVFNSLIPGEWRIEEQSPPQFFQPTELVHTVSIYDGSNEPVTLTFENEPWTGLTVKKVDAVTGAGLPGAVMKLYEGTAAESTKFLGDFQTDENGIVVIPELESGKYVTIVEAQAPYGYYVDQENNVQTILIKPEAINENITVIFRNYEKPKLLLTKIDADTGQKVSGSVFRVARRSTAEYIDVTIGPSGSFLLENLEEDWYEVYELRSPTNYVISEEHYDIELIAGKTSELVVKNRKKPSLTIQKRDSMTLQPIENVSFEISVKNGASLGEFTTDISGEIVLKYVEPNQTYLIRETKGMPGYFPHETVHEVTLGENESKVIKIDNTPENPIILSKKDSVSGEPIPDTVFLVTHADGRLVGEYRTGQNGMATVAGDDVLPGWYLISEKEANPAYIASGETKLVELKYGAAAIVEFFNSPRTGLQIRKSDSITGAPIPDVSFLIEEIDGRVIGTYRTDEAGIINLPDQEEIWVQVTELEPAEGYKADNTPHRIKLSADKLNILEIRNNPYPVLKIVKLCSKTRSPLEGAQIRVYDKYQRELGTFTTNKLGQIILSGMDGDNETVYIQEIASIPGYELNDRVFEATLSWGKETTVEILNDPLSSLRLTKICAESKEPIYGAVFLLYDDKNNLLGEYTTDQNGVIEFPSELAEGKYKLKEVKCEGYVVDPTIRTFEVRSGETTELTIENEPIRGRIQIIKKAANYNSITKDKEGALLEGAVFEIFDAQNKVVDIITTDSRGNATSKPLPAGVYGWREITSPPYYILDDTVSYAAIKVHNDLVRFEFFNKSEELEVDVTKYGNYEAMPGDTIRYDFENIKNASSVELESFYWHDELPTDAVRLKTIHTGTWNEHLTYSVEYQTNKRSWRTLESGLSSRTSHELDCRRSALHLKSGEYVTAFRFNFGTVQAGFQEEEAPYILCTVSGDLPNGYRFVNRTDAGGRRNKEWIIDKDTWVTVVFTKKDREYPKTGF